MISQNKLILTRLKQGKPISPLYALKQFGCMRLAARIQNLRDKGHDIKTEIVKHNDKRFALYSLVES